MTEIEKEREKQSLIGTWHKTEIKQYLVVLVEISNQGNNEIVFKYIVAISHMEFIYYTKTITSRAEERERDDKWKFQVVRDCN